MIVVCGEQLGKKTPNKVKMVKIHTEFSKLRLIILLFVFCLKCCNAEFELKGFHDFVRFERMKKDLFTRSNEKLSHHDNSTDDWRCLRELDTIGTALTKSELWAEKLVDAWGKIPSGILDGNVFDFGSFSECFHIDRNGELYKTKYCLGQVELLLDGIPKSQFPNREIIPRPDNGSALTFGICSPVECSSEFLQKFFMEQTNDLEMSMPIKLLENTCQIEEYPSKFTTLDWFATALLLTTLIVVLMSTAYDIYCTINKREKSGALMAFSVYTNLTNLLSCESPKSKDVIRCLDGIRALTAAWICFSHVFKYFTLYPTRNVYNGTYYSSYISMTPLAALFSVDTFLVISGLLVANSILRQLEKTKGKINVPMLYFHRYIRLTPLLVVVMLLTLSLYRFLGNGPIWPIISNGLREPCEKNWWRLFLYFQNYITNYDACVGVSWYLSVDMQLYIISPLIIYLIYRFKTKTLCALLILVLGCIGWTVAVHAKYGYKLFNPFSDDEMRYAYFPTHLRFSPWLVGVITGYFLHETRNEPIRIPNIINAIGWVLSYAVINAVIFGYYPLVQVDSTSTGLEHGLYFGISRVVWSIALCYIIFACHHNFGGPVNWFLGHRLWQPLSRLSFPFFLVHEPFFATMGTTMNALYFSERTAFFAAIANYAIGTFVAIVAALAFDMPITIINKLMFR